MDDQQPDIIPYTLDDFIAGTAPYEYLWKMRDNRFRQSQEVNRLERCAKALGLPSQQFKALWKNYQLIMAPTRETLVLANVTEFPNQELTLKCDCYICDLHGVYLDDAKLGMLPICSHPIMPTKRITNLDSNECKTEIAWYRDHSWKHQIFDGKTLGSAQQIIALKNVGIDVTSETARQMVSYLGKMESLNWDVLPQVNSIGRLGWMAQGGFSPYDNSVTFDGQEQYRHAFEAVKPCGSFDVWAEIMTKMRSGPSVAARIMLAASFSSALVEPLNALPYIVHVWANASGIGKTVSLMAAASVWANPRQGEYVKTYNVTNVGLEMTAGFYGSMPICMDELQLRGGQRDQFDAMIYQYCEGVGRTRGSKNGGTQPTKTWRNCMISTGEEPLTSGNSKAGAINRVIDVAVGDTPTYDDLRGTVALITANYGHAGPMFVKSLTKSAMDEVKAIQERFYRQLEGKATDKQRLSASIILTADTWAERVIFRDGKRLTVDDIAPYLQSDESLDVNKRAYEWLLDTISANPSRFSASANNGELWGEIDEAANQAYIIKSVFDRIMQDAGYNSVGFLAWAKRRGRLRTDGGQGDQRLTKKKRLKGVPAPARCVCIQLDDADALVDPQTGYVRVDEQTELPF